MSAVQFKYVNLEEDGIRLDRWFKLNYPQIPHALLNKLLRKGQVRVDGKRMKANSRLAKGQRVKIPPVNLDSGFKPRADIKVKPLSRDERQQFQAMILHEDKHLIVLNKPSGLAVQGGSKTRKHIDGMLQALESEYKTRPRLVHRLDRDTSGVLVIAKRRSVAAKLGKMFQSRTIHKTYWAAVKGVPKVLQGKIDMSLIKTNTAKGEMVRPVYTDNPDAQRAVTHYAVIDRASDSISWVSLQPVTGRQHQLRAHMTFTGTPILGDGKYDGLEDLPDGVEPKLHLHARRISFPHPAGGRLDVTAPLPEHMVKTWKMFGFDPNRYDDDLEDL